MSNQPSYYVLVYGTLRNGEHNHHYLANAELITMLRMPHFSMVSLGAYPAVYPSDSSTGILCELYKIDEATFADLDMLEGYPIFYKRTQVKLMLTADQPLIHAWIYHMDEQQLAHKIPIKNGDWVAFNS